MMKPSVRAFIAIACLGSVLSFPSRAERLALPGEPADAGWMLVGALAVAAVIARRRCQWASLRGSPAISPVPKKQRPAQPAAAPAAAPIRATGVSKGINKAAKATKAANVAGATAGTATTTPVPRPLLHLVRSD